MMWNWDGKTASCHQGDWIAEVCPEQLQRGLQMFLREVAFLPFFQIEVHVDKVESYVRGADLISGYAENQTFPFGLQIDYRQIAASNPLDFALELWLSIQTSQLDANPRVVFRSEGATNAGIVNVSKVQLQQDAKLHGSHQGIAALTGAAVSQVRFNGKDSIGDERTTERDKTAHWLILVHPSDKDEVEWKIDRTPGSIPETILFGGFMEKGVIRRARLRFFLSHSPWSMGRVIQEIEAFSKSPLPLNT